LEKKDDPLHPKGDIYVKTRELCELIHERDLGHLSMGTGGEIQKRKGLVSYIKVIRKELDNRKKGKRGSGTRGTPQK